MHKTAVNMRHKLNRKRNRRNKKKKKYRKRSKMTHTRVILLCIPYIFYGLRTHSRFAAVKMPFQILLLFNKNGIDDCKNHLITTSKSTKRRRRRRRR